MPENLLEIFELISKTFVR